jgi:hypothetical protein
VNPQIQRDTYRELKKRRWWKSCEEASGFYSEISAKAKNQDVNPKSRYLEEMQDEAGRVLRHHSIVHRTRQKWIRPFNSHSIAHVRFRNRCWINQVFLEMKHIKDKVWQWIRLNHSHNFQNYWFCSIW